MFDLVSMIFVIAAVLGYFNSRVLKMPAAIGVMTAALVGSVLIIAVELALPQLGLASGVRGLMSEVDFAAALMHGMLSFLLFAGAMHVDMGTLRKWLAPILTLASIGVLISTALVGVGSWLLFDLLGLGIPFVYCLVFGSLISPTDPVAVLGIMRQAGAPEEIEIKVVGESLFNDGIGVVLFSVLLAVAIASTSGGASLGAVDVLVLLLEEVGGGVLLGLLAGFVTYGALRTLNEPNLEVLITVSMVMGLTSLALAVHASAPLAAVVAGLFIGNRGRTYAMGVETCERLDAVWSFVDEALNVVLFLLIGLEVVVLSFEGSTFAAAMACIVIVLLARAIGVAVPMTLLDKRFGFRAGTRRILVWGGIRGGISVALALSIPAFPGRNTLIAVTYVVVVVSVLSQGLTIGKLIERLIPAEDRPARDAH